LAGVNLTGDLAALWLGYLVEHLLSRIKLMAVGGVDQEQLLLDTERIGDPGPKRWLTKLTAHTFRAR
jgi:hypothetical protein